MRAEAKCAGSCTEVGMCPDAIAGAAIEAQVDANAGLGMVITSVAEETGTVMGG